MRGGRLATACLAMLLISSAIFAVGYCRISDESEAGAPLAYEATRRALSDPMLLEQAASLSAIFGSASPAQLEPIVRAYEDSHSGRGPSRLAADMLGEFWARTDPAGALERIERWGPHWRKQLTAPLFFEWAQRDPATARRRAASFDDPKLRKLADHAVALGTFVAGGPDAFAEYGRAWPFGREALLDICGLIAGREGFDELISRVEAIPDDASPEFRAGSIRAVALLGPSIAPRTAARFVEKHASAPIEGIGNLRGALADSWAKVDPRAAVTWVVSQPEGRERNYALRMAFGRWTGPGSTSRDAVDWAESQPTEIQHALRDLQVRALLDIDPERAAVVAESLSPALRGRLLGRGDPSRKRPGADAASPPHTRGANPRDPQ